MIRMVNSAVPAIKGWGPRDRYSYRTHISLKRKRDETEEDDATMIPCRFIDGCGCGIHLDKPGVCGMYPFASYIEYESGATIVIHAMFQFTGDCPGFYVDASIESMMPTLKKYSKKMYNYNMAFARTKRENYCASSSVNLTRLTSLKE